MWLTLSSPFQLPIAAPSSSSLKSAFSPLCFQCLHYLKLRYLRPPSPLRCAHTQLLLYCPIQEGLIIRGGSLLVALPHLAPTYNPPMFLPSFPPREQETSLPSQCKLLFTAKSTLLNLMVLFLSWASKEVEQSLYPGFKPNQSFISLTMTIEPRR